MKKNHLFIGAAALIIAATAGYIAWDRHQTKTLQDATFTRIDNATQALRAALAPPNDPVAQSQAIAAAADRVDGDLAALRATETSRILLLGAAADTYLHGTRELLKRQAAMLMLDSGVRNGIIAFRDHLLGNRAAPDWTGKAVRLKNRLEEDFRDYRRAADAHAKIADGLPDARNALAAVVPENRLITTAEIAALRTAALSAAKALTGELDAARRLAAPR